MSASMLVDFLSTQQEKCPTVGSERKSVLYSFGGKPDCIRSLISSVRRLWLRNILRNIVFGHAVYAQHGVQMEIES